MPLNVIVCYCSMEVPLPAHVADSCALHDDSQCTLPGNVLCQQLPRVMACHLRTKQRLCSLFKAYCQILSPLLLPWLKMHSGTPSVSDPLTTFGITHCFHDFLLVSDHLTAHCCTTVGMCFSSAPGQVTSLMSLQRVPHRRTCSLSIC